MLRLQRVPLDKKGLTLVEITIALLVLLLVFLALMQTALVSIGYNMNNVLRDEAVSIADMRMDDARSLSYTQTLDNLISDNVNLPTGTVCPPVPDPVTGVVGAFPATGVAVQRNLKNVMNFPFCTNRTVTPLGDSQTKQVTITVGWIWKGENFNHSYTTIVRQQ